MKRTKPTVLELCSYSSGTMLSEDLIPTFLDVAKSLRLSKDERKTVLEIEKVTDAATEDSEYWTSEYSDNDLESLFDILQNHTPDYCYFGAHPGDGADYGVWIVEDLMYDTHQGSYDGYVWRLDEDESPNGHIDKSYTHALQVNERGNATLYRRSGRRWIEVWSVV